MDATTVIVFVISIVFAAATLWATILFVRRKNPTKIGSTEEQKEKTERPKTNEIEDPLNPTDETN